MGIEKVCGRRVPPSVYILYAMLHLRGPQCGETDFALRTEMRNKLLDSSLAMTFASSLH
jgi:hypothetical protein